MSLPFTHFRLFYPDSNTITALNIYDPNGAALTPQTVADATEGALDPVGFKSKVLIFDNPESQPLFVTATFSNPAAPVSLYLCRDNGGSTFTKVIDETLFNPADPGRPTPKGDQQQWLLYNEVGTESGTIYTVKEPVNPVAIIKPLAKDPVTGEMRYGNDFLFRWQGVLASFIEVDVDVDDIIDPTGFYATAVNNITTYAESSMGLSLVQAIGQIIPQDGLEHLLKFRLRYNVNGDISPYVETPTYSAIHKMPPPNPPVSLTAQLLRDRIDTIADVVHFEWEKSAENGGDGIEIYTHTVLDKKHLLYSSNGVETSCRVDNVSRFVVRDTGPASAEEFRFYIVSKNISGKSDPVYSDAPLDITVRIKESKPPTPDEEAGTAREVNYATIKAETYADVLSAMGSLPTEGQSIVNATIDSLILKIKDVVRMGGSVDLMDFGIMAAKWTNERLARNPATGAPVVVPAYRSLGFTPSLGFKTGTKNGTILTDAEAKLAS